MSSLTTNYDLIKPEVNSPTDQDLWGGYLNSDLDVIDAQLLVASNFVTETKTTAYSVVAGDNKKLIEGDATSAAFTVTLPAVASTSDGFTIAIKKTDSSANAVTIEGNASEEIDGELSYVLSDQYDYVILQCDTTKWNILSARTSLDNAALTGIPTAPTAASGTNTTQIATTAFVQDANPIKAFVNFQGSNGMIIHDRGVDNVVRNGTGDYTITFSPALASADYAVQLSFGNALINGSNGTYILADPSNKTTTQLGVKFVGDGFPFDPTQVYVSVIL